MKHLLLVLLLVASTTAKSEVRALNLEVKRLPFVRDNLFPDDKYWDYQLNLIWNVDVGPVFMENDIDTRTRNDRFRYVAWEYKLGVHLGQHVDVLWHHRSEHAMDIYRKQYPVRDSYGVRFKFMGDK